MDEKSFISAEFQEKIQDHSAELGTFLKVYKLLRYCIENEVYMDNPSEICCLIAILEKYLECVKSNFYCLQKELGIL